MNIERTQTMLRSAGVIFSPGLTSSEIKQVEERYGFSFPPDLKDFLMSALPVSTGFVDWRNGNPQEILSRLSWPYEGICFDIEHSGFWLPKWGKRPLSLDEAFATAKREIDSAPPTHSNLRPPLYSRLASRGRQPYILGLSDRYHLLWI